MTGSDYNNIIIDSKESIKMSENLTYVPIDLDAIDPNQMTDREKGYLNAYHARVYELVSPFLNDEEAQWLKKYTRAI